MLRVFKDRLVHLVTLVPLVKLVIKVNQEIKVHPAKKEKTVQMAKKV